MLGSLSVKRSGRMAWCGTLLLLCALVLSGCHTTGNNFSSQGLARLEPGVSTYYDAVESLESDPVNKYFRPDGSYMARWAHVNSLFPDGVYMDREIWLEFDAFDYLIRVSKRHNVYTPEPPPYEP